MTPTEAADALLFALWRTRAEALELSPTRDGSHRVSLDLERGHVACLELDSGLADAVAARFALLASLDFTASEERTAALSVRVESEPLRLRVSVRPAFGNLALEVRRVEQTEPARRISAGLLKPEHVGDYQLQEELGRGALGVVYRAEHLLLRRPAAVKIWTLPNTRVSKANAALLREARAAAATRHPGVIEVYDILLLPDGRMAMIMELLNGEMLSMRLFRERALPLADAVSLSMRIAEVLEATHDAGIVHRDLKPENVCVLPDGRVKVLDFGAALSVEEADQRPGTLGTPWYMAPEQAQGTLDRRSDIYSLGCILFEMIAGVCPFDGPDARVVLAKHLADPVPVPESPHGPLPEALERTIMRALDKRASARQQSAGELLRELRAVQEALNRPGFRRWLSR